MSPGLDNASVCCIGGMTVDRILRLRGPGPLGTTSAVHSRRAHGGTARNVAACLARLAVRTRLLSIVGDDQDGRELVLETAQQGIDTGLVQKSLSRPTGSFITVEKLDGSLFAAFADMEVCESMDRGFIQSRWNPIAQSPLVFADAWLPPDSLAWLIAGCREQKLPLLLDAVSTATARHLPLNLNGVTLLTCGTDEARTLLGDELERDAPDMAAALHRRGAARVAVTGRGRLACAGHRASFVLDTDPASLGDPMQRAALIAGTACARLEQRPWRASLETGIEAARLIAAADGEPKALSAEALASRRPGRRARPSSP